MQRRVALAGLVLLVSSLFGVPSHAAETRQASGFNRYFPVMMTPWTLVGTFICSNSATGETSGRLVLNDDGTYEFSGYGPPPLGGPSFMDRWQFDPATNLISLGGTTIKLYFPTTVRFTPPATIASPEGTVCLRTVYVVVELDA